MRGAVHRDCPCPWVGCAVSGRGRGAADTAGPPRPAPGQAYRAAAHHPHPRLLDELVEVWFDIIERQAIADATPSQLNLEGALADTPSPEGEVKRLMLLGTTYRRLAYVSRQERRTCVWAEGCDELTEDEFTDFYIARKPQLVRALYLQTGDAGKAEEIAQEAFIRAWTSRTSLTVSDPVRWLLRVAFRLAVSNWRRQTHLESLLIRHDLRTDISPPPAEIVEARILVSTLPTDHKAAIILYYFEDLSLTEVAEVLGLPAGTVKSRLHRARSALQEQYDVKEM